MAAISTIFNAFISGSLDPYWTHFWLLAGAFTVEIIVAIGIVLEMSWPPNQLQIIATVMVIGGVVIGIIFTLGLFVFDEAISRNQQEKIVALETRLAPRLLSEEQKGKLRLLRGKVPALAFMATGGIEPAFYSAQLQAETRDNDGISIRVYPASPAVLTMGIQICVPDDYDADSKSLLFKAFTEDNRAPGECKFDDIDPSAPKDIPLIDIGVRPFVYMDTQDPSKIKILYYPDFGKQKR
jgi:hypothetical protein